MIKVNLKTTASAADSAILAGIDISQIKWPWLIAAFVLSQVPEFGIRPIFEGQLDSIKAERTKIENELKNINQEIRKQATYRKLLLSQSEEEKNLQERLRVVREVINKRSNPQKILYYVAENIPKDVWIENLKFQGTSLKIEGASLEYGSIGVFISKLKESVFFNGQVDLKDYSTVTSKKRRIEKFKIEANVENFE